ncbi:site-specific DNA-methyltransferase [Mycoplasmopsis felis]|uniref:site-specific DNA-methyltransferase n=1 Tax=Mycoplasmopsis felis TaxID=33923 RepID=UPI002AFE5A5A|nr:site-specific DNA-methyltransferase [Mycoplasmopsis felis]WQQ06582.1 site-specific DNA-methyltransferase [Mycoplasmopsis felis]
MWCIKEFNSNWERERAGLEYKYDLIYIDPPYNTETSKDDGNSIADDKENIKANKFIYRDKYSRNGWLNLMNERLRLARQLLKDDGVIFVSIDDAEQAYLKVLMDEIFGEENFVSCIVNKKGGGKSDSKFLSNKKEYILVYAININNLEFRKQSSPIENYKYEDNKGKYSLRGFDMQGLDYTKSLDYPIEAPDGTFIYPGKSYEKYIERNNGNFQEKDWCWTLSKKEYNDRLQKEEIVFLEKKGEWRVYYKSYYEGKSFPYSDLLTDFQNTNGANELKSIFKTRVFPYPKPVNLIKFLLNLKINKRIRILDFFAGSGTTGHAVLDLNKQDNGNRTFTLVTNNENNIGIDITYERLYRINQGKGTQDEEFPWLKNNKPYLDNLNVYKMNYYNIDLFDNQKNIDQLIEILTELLVNFGLDKNQIQNLKEIDLLTDLSSLKPLIKDEDGTN